MRLQQHIDNNDLGIIIEAMVIIEECRKVDEINEGVTDSMSKMIKSVKSMLKKKKPEVSKMVEKEKGLIHYFKDLGVGGSQMMYHAFNAYYNKNNESKQRVKELSKSVKKEHVMDVLLKLDVLSLHLVTGPLHILEAVTGWNILHHIKNKVEPVEKRIKTALHALESLKNDLTGDMKTQLLRYTNGLRRVFDVGEFQKIKEETIGADVASPDMVIGEPVRRRLKTQKGKLKKNPKKK
jgi:hypothetical protein